MPLTLTITLDATAVATINAAGQSITLAQSVTAMALSGSELAASTLLPLAWLVFSPLESNTITWSADYELYATTTPLFMGNVVALNSISVFAPGVAPGTVYTFAAGVFKAQTGTGTSYMVSNQAQGSFSFGLTATATVNSTPSTGPLNALPLLFAEEGFFAPPASVLIFLSSATANGTVLPTIPGAALELSLGGGSLAAEVCFNDTTNDFFLCPPT